MLDGRPRRLRAAVSLLLLLAVCGAASAASAPVAPVPAPEQVTIAYQPGIGYANLIVVKQQQVLERQFPSTRFNWQVLASGAAIRDGVRAGQIQVGAGGVGPFLVGWDQGVGWKLLAALNEMDLWLVARDPTLQSLRDFGPGRSIGMPAADSVQAVVLRKGAQEQLGDARALDANIVGIAHPDGVRALASGQLAGHLSAPPFQEEEVQAGGHVLLRSYDLFGPSTFGSAFMDERFYDQYPDLALALYQAIVDATRLIAERPAAAAALLAAEHGEGGSPEQFTAWLTAEGVSYTTTPRGFLRYAEFMRAIGLLRKAPGSMRDLTLPPLAGAGD